MSRPTNTHLILLCSYSDVLENNSTVLHQIMLSVAHLWNPSNAFKSLDVGLSPSSLENVRTKYSIVTTVWVIVQIGT